jgi:hypothetical protein
MTSLDSLEWQASILRWCPDRESNPDSLSAEGF